MDSPTSHNLSDNISKSSLVSLKAELLRKQQEIKKLQNESKNTSSGIVNCAKYRDKPITKLNINDKTNKNVTQRNDKDLKSQPNTIEETEELKHSQDALVAKTKIYDDLMKGKKVLDNSKQVLVNFDKKLKEKCDSDDDCVELESQDNGDSDDEWTEFTDALGRTRKCLKEDLKFYQAQNRYLKETKCSTGANEHAGKLDTKTKDKSNVHYQDILFGEARQHGVGYFGFSSDETERARQIETLNEMRDTTRLERDKVRQMRRLRRRQFKTRLRATENRKRESQGLPPLPASPDTSSSDEDKAEHEADVARTQSLVSDLVARKLEEIRRANKTREWDVGKDGQMSQEEWVEKQRAQRRAEFAPPESLIGLIGEEGKVGGQRGSAPRERSVGEEAHEEEKFGGPRGFAPRERSISGEGEPPRARRSREARSGEFEDAPRMSAEQMLARMEAEEAYSAGSIFCFKRKWAERNKQVFKRYQRTEGQSGGETTSIGDSGKKCDRSGERSFPKYEGRSDSRKPVTYPLVDTRFMANKDVLAKVEKPCANSDEGKNNNERENTDNTCKRENIDERRKTDIY
ncbi:coiled-coil domain-containing protein 174 [Diaphorina citri]|uniref:Coiled-coil domain-containing protein 174 n=1 Tax=Diaphorina citri TaxID=121845 RepID=A0A3Q0J263_DIACI|nr:coiled-coil domain-containing protein 174 [Diaphorina citri]